MTKKRIKEDSSSSEPVVLATPAKSEPVVLATATKSKKIKIEKEEIVDLTGDPQFIDSADSAEGYDPIGSPRNQLPQFQSPANHVTRSQESTCDQPKCLEQLPSRNPEDLQPHQVQPVLTI
jgi:hypothetical protein